MPESDRSSAFQLLGRLFDAGVDAVRTDRAVQRHLSIDHHALKIADRRYALDDFARIHIVGAGKGAAPMAAALEELLGARVVGGDLVVKDGHVKDLRYVKCWEAAHPIPDARGVEGARAILRRVRACDEKDLVIVCITGGSSALMVAPVEPLTLAHKRRLSEVLLACGADIQEINTLRKHLSAVKGGRLLEAARPATVLSLIVSDVIGDDLSVIGSGPTVPDGSTFAECLGIIDKYRIADQLPPEVTAYLRRGAAGFAPETPKHPALFAGASHHLIATNALAIEAVRRAAEALNVEVEVLGSTLSGEARELAKTLADHAKARRRSPRSRPLLLIGGGETTVRLRGDGKGGRNQELALALAVELEGLPGVHVLCAGTDGTDGPTAAAGAFADGGTVEAAKSRGLSAVAHLRNNDSHPFFKAIDSLLITGPTLTNVMDLVLILVEAGDVPVKR